MSKLTIVDLNKAEELSSSEMAKATGGMDCLSGIVAGGEINRLGDFFNSLGDTEGAAYAHGVASGLANGACNP